jgi:hypothetical protein
VEGLKFKVSRQELASHLKSRSAYHRDRAAEKESSLPELKKTLESMHGNRAMANMMPSVSRSAYHMDPVEPVKDLERDIQDHRAKASLFLFFAEHLFEEDYVLREEDLARLEIIKRV